MVYGVIEARFSAYEMDEGDAYLTSHAKMEGIQYPELFWNVVFTKGSAREVVKEGMNRSFGSKLETRLS